MNLLFKESSPYLKQHVNNPVHWQPWGEAAFEEAKRRDVPVFLSIGYSTCHWCHVMAHESFEDNEVASILNEHFVSVKVDREERPDIDQVYMHICYAMTGQGGWPLTFVLFPDKRPFFAGTYLTKTSMYGRLGLIELLKNVTAVWRNQRSALEAEASEALGEIRGKKLEVAGKAELSHIKNAVAFFEKRFDAKHGGFSKKTKFPSFHNLIFLLRYSHFYNHEAALNMVEKTIYEISAGGIYDQIGFGIHRYSTEPTWHLPHFEKMLYDQALYIFTLAELYQKTKREFYRTQLLRTVQFVETTLACPERGYYTALDADTEHEEGKYYIFTYHELREILTDEELHFIVRHLTIQERGNFHDESTGEEVNANIFHWRENPTGGVSLNWDALPLFEQFEPIRQKILSARKKRTLPHLDNKILTDTNALYLAALAKAAFVLNDVALKKTAQSLAHFLLARIENGTLWHVKNNHGKIDGTLDDYAYTAWGLWEYYSLSRESASLLAATSLTDTLLGNFAADGGFYFTDNKKETEFVIRTREFFDGALPTGNAVALDNLWRLFQTTNENKYRTAYDKLLALFGGFTAEIPTACAHALGVFMKTLVSKELVFTQESAALDAALASQYSPSLALVKATPELAAQFPYLNAYQSDSEKYWLCRNFACEAPVASVDKIFPQL
ncbi:MAG TPA: thioredoxin domain-containing protein [Turneriella sp.]|nr:thioredoxin domain-containing protein [Turneriella sp.]